MDRGTGPVPGRPASEGGGHGSHRADDGGSARPGRWLPAPGQPHARARWPPPARWWSRPSWWRSPCPQRSERAGPGRRAGRPTASPHPSPVELHPAVVAGARRGPADPTARRRHHRGRDHRRRLGVPRQGDQASPSTGPTDRRTSPTRGSCWCWSSPRPGGLLVHRADYYKVGVLRTSGAMDPVTLTDVPVDPEPGDVAVDLGNGPRIFRAEDATVYALPADTPWVPGPASSRRTAPGRVEGARSARGQRRHRRGGPHRSRCGNPAQLVGLRVSHDAGATGARSRSGWSLPVRRLGRGGRRQHRAARRRDGRGDRDPPRRHARRARRRPADRAAPGGRRPGVGRRTVRRSRAAVVDRRRRRHLAHGGAARAGTERRGGAGRRLVARSSRDHHPGPGAALRDLVRLRRVRDRIDREYAQPLDVEALARGEHMSAGHLSREFKRAYGESPYGYLMTRRIERAMALLRRGDLSVTEVCFTVGCSSLGHVQHPVHRAGRGAAERLPGQATRAGGQTAGMPSCLRSRSPDRSGIEKRRPPGRN